MLASRQLTVSSISRDAWVEIDLSKIEHNVHTIRSWLSGDQVAMMAVVKSDGYGHGAVEIGRTALSAGATWLGVATVDEGLDLRQAGITAPILLLGPAPTRAIRSAVENNLDLTITNELDLEQTAQVANQLNRNTRLHLKIDTGMHRMGANPDQVTEMIGAIRSHANLEFISVFSHLAKADEEHFTRTQNDSFKNSLKGTGEKYPQLFKSNGGEVLQHIASGDAARLHEFAHHDMVRAGLTLYGLAPRLVSDVVKPAMSIRGRINQIRQIQPGEAVGYSLTWTANAPALIASIPIGYADGVDRGLSNRMTALLHGKRVNQVGLISMDQMLFDVTSVPEAKLGDILTLIGSDGDHAIHLADWANMLDTITYELACRMRLRLPRIYTHGEAVQV